VLPIVVAVAALGALLAPADWSAGEGRLELRHLERLVVGAPITVGDGDPIELEGGAAERRFLLRLPDGAPTDSSLRAELQILERDRAVQPALADLELVLVLPDGSSELIPVLRWDAEGQQLIAERRPPLRSWVLVALLAAVVVLWVSELVPLFVTSLAIPVVLVVSDVASAGAALAPFFHPIIALFFGGFLMAEAMRRVELDRLVALNLMARFGRTPVTLFAAMLAVSAGLSMWMSNTAATAVLLPIAMATTAPLGNPGYRRAVVLGLAFAATIGGVGSAIGTPANPLAIEFLSDFAGRDTSFVGWFPIGLPMVVVFLPIMGAYLWWRIGARVDAERFIAARRVAVRELAEAGPVTRDQLVVVAVFVGVMLSWLTQTWHDVDTGIIALSGALVLFVVGRLEPDDLGRVSWPSLLTFGGGLAMGLFLLETGTADWIATRLDVLDGLWSPLTVAIVALLALALTTVASNTATAAVLIPLSIPLAGVLGLDPVLLVMTIAVASSLDFALVVGTPPTMLAYSTRLFTAPQIFRVGIALDIAAILLLVTVVRFTWTLFGVV
jgi:sodium-dependent dicarboxylate transporter 2/3/5